MTPAAEKNGRHPVYDLRMNLSYLTSSPRSQKVRFISDAGGIICYYFFGSTIGYANGCWVAGSVAFFGTIADLVRNRYDRAQKRTYEIKQNETRS